MNQSQPTDQPRPGTSDTDVAAITTTPKIPAPWLHDIELWLAFIDTQFNVHKIRNDRTRYEYTLAALDPISLAAIRDVLVTQPEENLYETLKQKLREKAGTSRLDRFNQALSDVQLGDRKPSQLLQDLQQRTEGFMTNEAVQALWLQRLPTSLATVLAASNAPLTELGQLADRAHAISAQGPSAIQSVQTPEKFPSLEAIVDALEKRFQRRDQRRKSNNTETTESQKICWYHTKFGDKARKCNPPCSFTKAKND